MSDRTQDLKNLRAVATRCKNYTDAEIAKSEEKMKWYMGEYSVSTSDDNTSASTKTVPANATRCKIKRIYGLTQKLNPTTASDSTSYSVKTMPATVYDFDISKVEGNSEKITNLCSVTTTTVYPQRKYIENINDFTTGTYTFHAYNNSNAEITLYVLGYYDTNYIKDLTTLTIPANSGVFKTFNFTNNNDVNAIGLYNGTTTAYTQLGLYKGTVNTYVETSTIHNYEWNGVVVKNSDDEVMQNISIDLSSILYNGSPLFEGNSLKGVGTAKDYITPYVAHKEMGIVDLGSLTFASSDFSTTNHVGWVRIPNAKSGGYLENALCPTYDLDTTHSQGSMPNMSYYISNAYINIKNTSCNSASELKTALSGVYLVYELTTPIEVSINWASLLRGITGYSNGTISLLNTNNQDTANLITYNSMIKENCCAKMVQSRGGNVVKTVTFPTQASDGYSAVSVANIRDFTTNKRIGNVSKEDLGNYNWSFGTGQTPPFYTPRPNDSIPNSLNLLSPLYTAENQFWTIANNWYKMAIGNSNLNLSNPLYTDATTFKTAMANEPLYYELADASKTSTDITPIENVLEVQPGDELAFYDANDNLVTIPSDLTYRIEVAR